MCRPGNITTFMRRFSLNRGSLNFLETSRPVQGLLLRLPFTYCYGTAFSMLPVGTGSRKETGVELSEVWGGKGVGNVTFIRNKFVPLLQR